MSLSEAPKTYEFINELSNYSAAERYKLQVISVSASCSSIVFGLTAFYLYANMKRHIFRHHLILFLLLFDFGKAVVLILYPARILTSVASSENAAFCNSVGWLSSFFIEGADFAVLALAIHMQLLVTRQGSKVSRADNDHQATANGMNSNADDDIEPASKNEWPKWRFYMYPFNVLIPGLLASLAFVNYPRIAYTASTTWCYLPNRPVWYRVVLAWAPRYVILITIFAIYFSIYVRVKLEYREVSKLFSGMRDSLPPQTRRRSTAIVNSIKGSFDRANMRTDLSRSISHQPQPLEAGSTMSHSEVAAVTESANNESEMQEPGNVVSTAQWMAMADFQKEQVQNFEKRRRLIERQIRSIFIYPIAYVILWTFPLVLQAVQFRFEVLPKNTFWLSCIATFMQSWNCTIDSIAFMIRERPWQNSQQNVFTTKHIRRWLRFSSNECQREKLDRSTRADQSIDSTVHDRTNARSGRQTSGHSDDSQSSGDRSIDEEDDDYEMSLSEFLR